MGTFPQCPHLWPGSTLQATAAHQSWWVKTLFPPKQMDCSLKGHGLRYLLHAATRRGRHPFEDPAASHLKSCGGCPCLLSLTLHRPIFRAGFGEGRRKCRPGAVPLHVQPEGQQPQACMWRSFDFRQSCIDSSALRGCKQLVQESEPESDCFCWSPQSKRQLSG